MDKQEFSEFKIRFAIRGAGGNIGRAAMALGIARTELMEIVIQTPDMADFVRDVREQNGDICQEILGEFVEADAPWAIKYTLRTLGANRGYGNPGAGNRLPGAENTEAAASNCRLNPDDPLIPVVKALHDAKGHVTRAASTIGKSRSALQRLIAESPALQMSIFQEREALVDHAETALRKAIDARRPWAVMFTLSTLRRDAGFGRPAKRTNSAKPQLANPQQSPAPEFGAERSSTVNFESNVQDSASATAYPVRNEEPGIEIERNELIAPKQPQPILIGAAAGANGAPAPYDLAGVAAKLSGTPIANRSPQCARNAPCPCASGLKYKRCCGA